MVSLVCPRDTVMFFKRMLQRATACLAPELLAQGIRCMGLYNRTS